MTRVDDCLIQSYFRRLNYDKPPMFHDISHNSQTSMRIRMLLWGIVLISTAKKKITFGNKSILSHA